jgi:flagellar hook assembly protein FlgD
MQLTPAGSVFYWDGRLKSGEILSDGIYQVRVQAYTEADSVTVYSEPFTINQGG